MVGAMRVPGYGGAIALGEPGSDGFHRSWIMLFPEGEYEHPQYGDLKFTQARLSEIKRLFDQRVRHIDIALDADHDAGKATGWLEQLQLRPATALGEPAGLWGLVRWTPYGAQLLKDQIYRYFSPEFGPWKDPASGKSYQNVLIGGGLTNRPFLKEMAPVKLADGTQISTKPWGSVNKSMLPRSCFLDQGDPDKKSTWRLPVYEGAGPKDADGCYTQRGALNINAVRAALAALGGAHTGAPMSGVPAGVKAKLQGWLKKYGGQQKSQQASEPDAGMQFFNPNHDAHSGEFSSGGGSGGGKASGGLRQRVGAIKEKLTGKGKPAAAAAPERAESLRSVHERAARLQQEGHLPHEAQPEERPGRPGGSKLKPVGEKVDSEDLYHNVNQFGHPNPAVLARVYGEHQLGATLARYSPEQIAGAARALGVKEGGSKAETISRITAHVTQGRYSANFAKRSAKAGGGSSQKAHEPTGGVVEDTMGRNSQLRDDEDELDERDESQTFDDTDDDSSDSMTYDDGGDGEDDGDDGFDAKSNTHGQLTTDGHTHGKFAEHPHDGDADHSDAPLKGAKKMSERVTTRRLREAFEEQGQQLAEMREQLYRRDVADTLAAWDRGKFQFSESPKSQSGKALPMVALSRRFREVYSSFMLSELGASLPARARKQLNNLVETALSAAVVDLSARGASFDQEKRRTIRGGQQGKRAVVGEDIVELAEKRAQAAGKRLSQLSYDERLQLMTDAEREIGDGGLPY